MDGWKVISCENNVTVLRGTEQHNASSIMLSYVIRAPPRLCMKVKGRKGIELCLVNTITVFLARSY